MCMKEFKQRLQENRGKSYKNNKVNNSVLEFSIGNFIVKFDRGNIRIGEQYAVDQVKDILLLEKKLSNGKLYRLSQVSDVDFDVHYQGWKLEQDNKVLYFKAV